jgi:hypothetical protein
MRFCRFQGDDVEYQRCQVNRQMDVLRDGYLNLGRAVVHGIRIGKAGVGTTPILTKLLYIFTNVKTIGTQLLYKKCVVVS